MRNTIYILILTIIISSCQSDKKLNGNWIGDYSYTIEKDEIFIWHAVRRILTFDDGLIIARGSKYDYGTDIDKGKYNLTLKTLEFEGGYENYEIEIFESDSLVLKRTSSPFRYVYRKLPDSLKHNSEIEFIGKQFKWENNKFTDTVFFKNQTFFKLKSRKYNNGEVSWERIKHNGYDIIFIDGAVPYIIKEPNNESLLMWTFQKIPSEHKLTEIK